jgi:hypothetical protein
MFIDGVIHEHARQTNLTFSDDERWILDTVYKHTTPQSAIISPVNWKRWDSIDPGKLTHIVGLAVGYLFRSSMKPTLQQNMHGYVNYHCAINMCHFMAGFSDRIIQQIAHDLIGIPMYSTLCGRDICVRNGPSSLTKCTECAKVTNETITEMATECSVNRDYGIMPIMADALEDAGCTNEVILDHCRSSGPHGRGCWLLRHCPRPKTKELLVAIHTSLRSGLQTVILNRSIETLLILCPQKHRLALALR